ncbi:cysteine desulfurase family protein [Mucilaginibacter paludis]|uniref:cysteine desulfurase n=1 Tax=Mucilaginibacter paludis DSM 18603 TaxID=714943 RepID=H1YBD1_9SPHI|nr:cysteine desulfurase family protein [Mucilaginibacter paludis]EHQ31185.1 aminotransferase class V [Mucilaginibacter paludis DSM 18603]
MKIYLDNAATTPLEPQVFEAMTPFLLNHFGNPSSQHHHGREVKSAIEESRKIIAQQINALPEEIIFTSGGTEADNIAILSAVQFGAVKHVITTSMEHHAVLNTLEALRVKGDIQISFVKNDEKGNLDYAGLELLLRTKSRSLVSIMHANNEIGNINDIERIALLCEKYDALFHTDTVQTMGHYRFNLKQCKIHFLTASAHKFHGPKGIGFLYFRKGLKLTQLIKGGGQENSLRAGTENIAGIVGLASALKIANLHLKRDHDYILSIKRYLKKRLVDVIPDIKFNGNSSDDDQSLYTVLSVNFPYCCAYPDLLRHLDQSGISVSGGSACSKGAASHVLEAVGIPVQYDTVRFSFSKLNTLQEIDYVIQVLSSIYQTVAA